MIRKGLRIAFISLALLVVVALAAAVVVWQTRRPALAARLEQLLQNNLIDNDSTRIEIGNVSGNPLGALKLHDVSLLVRDGNAWKTFVTVQAIKVDFSVSKISRHAVEVDVVDVERPVVSAERGSSGRRLWPHFKKKKGPRVGPGFKIGIDRLIVRGGFFKVHRRKDDLLFSDIDLETSFERDTSGVIGLKGTTTSFSVLPWGHTAEKLSGDLFFRGSSVGSDSLSVTTPSSSFSVRGLYAFGGEKVIDLDFLVERLSLGEMRRFQQLSFLPDGGELSGRASVTRKGYGPTALECDLAGAYGNHPVESLEASAELGHKRWHAGFRLLSNGSVLEGTFDAMPDSRQECAVDFRVFDPGDWPELLGQEEIPHGSLDGAFRFAGKSLTSSGRQGTFEVILDGGDYAGFSFLRADLIGEFDGQGGLVVPGVEIQGAGYSATVSGRMSPEGAKEFDFDGTVKELDEFSWVRDRFGLTGDLRVNGRLEGDSRKLLLDASAYGAVDGTSPSTVSGLMKAAVVKGQVWPVVCLGTSASFAPATLFGSSVDSVGARAVLLKGGAESAAQPPGLELLGVQPTGPGETLIMASLSALRADTSLSADASVEVNRDGVHAGVTGLTLAAGRTRWTAPRSFRLDWEHGTLRVSGLKLASQHGTLSLDGSIEPRAEKSVGTLEADVTDLSAVAGRFLPVAGKLKGRLEAERDGGSTRLEAELDWKDASISGRRFDGLSLSAVADEREVDIRKLKLLKAGGTVEVSGRVSLPCGLPGLADTLSARRSLPSGASADLVAEVHDLDMSSLADWHETLDSLGGRVSASLRVEGRLEEPSVKLAVSGTDVRIDGYEVSGVGAEASLSGGVCTVSRLEVTERNARGSMRGSFPLDVDLCRGRVMIPDGPLDLDVQLAESDFAVASLFIKQIASSSGMIRGSVRMSGRVKDPEMEGAFSVSGATLRPAGREEVFEHLEAEVTLDEKVLELVRFSATQGQEGRLEGNGRIHIGQPRRGEYRFAVKGKKVTAGDPDDMAMKFDCDLVISSVEVAGSGTWPLITGRIDVRQGVIAREFTSGVGGGGASRWLCDVELEVPNNVWLKNIDAEIELAGSLTAKKDTGGMVLLGTLRILRGKYYVFDNEFRIVSGSLEFKDVGRIDPELNIEAQTSASGREILLTLTGKLSEPNIRFTCEDENLTQAEVLRLLTLGKYVDASPSETSETGIVPGVTGSVGNYFLRQVERRLARELKWVDSIELGGSLEGGSSLNELRWGLGKYVTPELYLRYSQGLVRSSERDVSIEYRLSELLFLRGGVTSKDRLTGKDRDEYTLDLRLKYEY
ncbi:MAG: translocation/assembly module TamB domain-containing protein [Candidatus Eisenbacteria bacterium]|nr:translocation/assembly module TamB domain-containing protein [Candidatus Eisenbacteria bacterium]